MKHQHAPLRTRSNDQLSIEVEKAYRSCEERLQNHQTHLLNSARTLQNPKRRYAFFATYVSLRVQAPACLPRPLGRARSLHSSLRALRAWSDAARLCHQGRPQPNLPSEIALADAMERFQIPVTPWMNLEKGLAGLARNEPPQDLLSFFTRARNLVLAPSEVFIRILCSRRGVRRYRMAKELNVHEMSHDPAVFAYIVGVVADVFNELDERKRQHSSIPLELLVRHRLSAESLRELRDETKAPENFLSLMQDMALFAWKFYESGVAKLTQAAALIPPEAIHYLDGFLDHYKVILKNLERADFAPKAFSQYSGGLEPRISLGVQAPGFSQDVQ